MVRWVDPVSEFNNPIGWDQKLPLVEKFSSIQGEGLHAGRPALFIRFSGCNLDCVFADGSICDTPWRKAKEIISLQKVYNWARRLVDRHYFPEKLLPSPERQLMVVLTGGEPTLAKGFDDLITALRLLPVFIAVETNGTIWRGGLNRVDHITISPKQFVKHPRGKDSPKLNKKVLGMTDSFPTTEFRYVVTPEIVELGFIQHLSQMIEDFPTSQFFVSPALESDGTGLEFQSREIPEFVEGAVAECIGIVKSLPKVRLSLQTHKWIRVR